MLRLQPYECAAHGADSSRQRSGETHQGARVRCHARGIPAYIGAEAGNEHRQVRGETASSYRNQMTELVDQNEHGQSHTEPDAVERPVNGREGGEAQQELELEQRKEKLSLEQEQRNRGEGPELAGPSRWGLFRRFLTDGLKQLVALGTHPGGLRRIGREQLERGLPVVMCSDELLALLMRAGVRGKFLEPLRVHHGLTSTACQGTRCERRAAAAAQLRRCVDGQLHPMSDNPCRRRGMRTRRRNGSAGGKAPGEADADEENDESDQAVNRVPHLEKGP